MEIRVLYEMFTGKDPKSLMDHIQKMASGEAPFYSTTLSLVYDKVVEELFTKRVPPGRGPGELTEGQSATVLTPPQPSISTPMLPRLLYCTLLLLFLGLFLRALLAN